jgi:hypothetical protein
MQGIKLAVIEEEKDVDVTIHNSLKPGTPVPESRSNQARSPPSAQKKFPLQREAHFHKSL